MATAWSSRMVFGLPPVWKTERRSMTRLEPRRAPREGSTVVDGSAVWGNYWLVQEPAPSLVVRSRPRPTRLAIRNHRTRIRRGLFCQKARAPADHNGHAGPTPAVGGRWGGNETNLAPTTSFAAARQSSPALPTNITKKRCTASRVLPTSQLHIPTGATINSALANKKKA